MRVFVAYASEDRETVGAAVDKLRASLGSRRVTIRWDQDLNERGLDRGEWQRTLGSWLGEADHFIWMMSPRSAGKPEIYRECGIAERSGATVHIQPIEDTPLEAPPESIRRYHWQPTAQFDPLIQKLRLWARARWRRRAIRLLGTAAALVVACLVILAWPRERLLVLMDSPLLIYDLNPDPHKQVTNGHDIEEALDDLHLKCDLEMTMPTWNRDERILEKAPDMVVIHWSAFESESVSKEEANTRLKDFLRYMARSRTHFLIYSRTADWGDEEFVRGLRTKLKDETGVSETHLHLFFVEGREDRNDADGWRANFREDGNASRLKARVKAILDL